MVEGEYVRFELDGGNMESKKVTGFDYLWCALYAFASVAFELLVVAVEGVCGIDMNNFTTTQNIVH